MKPGDLVPDFTLPDETGEPRSLSGFLSAGPLVLFFYPAAMTTGCTAESCHFRDLAEEFAETGAQRVGISPDPVARQQEFSAKHGFDYPLLSDVDGAVATLFGVRRKFGPLLTRRHTFVIDTDRRVLEVVKSELRMSAHADQALRALRSRGV
ncbi:peroxiredoxin [Amycolatopsis acidiphila]|uniref:thioredoxin-dependent peroxiredoxin n=1 Tax=Amycolatopsis acidiphila TaxID=715473 RepID=A0A558A1D2_9PSEU|nr:peroxiredoxin [Amycolatopsis acidiphila]TVT18071.1 peroxiredoxin [Amycolatopsis acidiphila]UIJ56643.1 peroxiredoxin [Amycolatopsis acidiphila]GHG56042.1 peroxiredoxin [Amycolatopsis acidiphila]